MTDLLATLGQTSDVEGVLASGAWLPAALPIPGPSQGTVDLVSSARTITGDTDGGVRWVQGFTVVGDACGPIYALDPCEFDPDPLDFAGLVHYSVLPYTLVAGATCSTFGATPDSMVESARRLLNSGSASAALERQLWGTSIIGTNPTFLSEGEDVVGTFAPIPALAELEQVAREKAPGLGRYMIHASPRVASIWAAQGGLRKVGTTLLTYLDTVIVAGSGYPTGTGEEVAYVTGIVTVHLSDVLPQPEPALFVDRGSNTTVATAARFAAATWPPCLPPQGVTVTVSTP
jgi:hypothetical protein